MSLRVAVAGIVTMNLVLRRQINNPSSPCLLSPDLSPLLSRCSHNGNPQNSKHAATSKACKQVYMPSSAELVCGYCSSGSVCAPSELVSSTLRFLLSMRAVLVQYPCVNAGRNLSAKNLLICRSKLFPCLLQSTVQSR